MVYYSEILHRFGFTNSDKEYIDKISDILILEENKFIEDVINYIKADKHIEPDIVTKLENEGKEKLSIWFKGVVTADINVAICDFIKDFDLNHTPKGYFKGERISAMFNFIRLWFQGMIFSVVRKEWECSYILKAYTKVINATVYITMDTYLPEDNITHQGESKIKSTILTLAERASLITHSMLLIFLICMTFGGVISFVWSLWDLRTVAPDKMFIVALGSLLVLWVLIELINSEIQMLRGDKFRISIFVGIVLIAFIREVLIMTLKHDSVNYTLMSITLFGILILGFTYWLLTKSEERASKI